MTATKKTYTLLYFFLLTPIFAYIYTAILRLPKNITFACTFLFFIYGLLFILWNRKIIFPKFILFILLFAIYRFIWMQFLGISTHILTHIYYSINFFAIFLATLIVYNTKFTDEFIYNSIVLFKVIVIITAIGSVIQVYYPNFLDPRIYFNLEEKYKFEVMNLYEQRRSSIFGLVESNALGLSFLPILSILTGVMLLRNDKTIYIYIVLGILSALLSNARYIMVGAFIISLQIILYNKKKFFGVIKYCVSIIVILFFTYHILINFGYNLNSWYEKRLFAEGSIEQTTRYKAIDNFLYFFPQTPFFGTGELTEDIREASHKIGSSHIHVGYLSHLVYYGIIGCFLLFGFWFLLAKKLYKTAKVTNYWGSFFAFIVFFWSFFTMSQSSTLYAGLIFALIFDKYYRDSYR